MHTPGPWITSQPRHDPQSWDVLTASRCVLAKLVWGQDSKANATLMAAAPELLEALELARSWVAIRLGDTHEDLIKIDAAIAKAKSLQPE